MTPTITRLTNSDPDFYPTLGPFLAQRAIVAELGAPVWDDAGKQWFVARDETGRVLGFRAVTVKARTATFCSAYVLPEHRNEGVYAALIADALDYSASVADEVKATVQEAAVKSLKKAGFKVVGARGKFTLMERTLGKAAR